MKRIVTIIILLSMVVGMSARRLFQHPGITYTQADIERMKALISVKAEPFYTTYQAMVASNWVTRTAGTDKPTTENSCGKGGRAAIDNALLYHLTGNTAYADKAVAWINNYSYITQVTSSTAALDGGKINLLIEAAELLRTYPGWKSADKLRFNKMLVNVFYPKLKDFDRGRYGNQGLFAARAIVAMGIYLDDEIKYDHAYRYLTCQTRRSEDPDKYPLGPATERSETDRTEFLITYNSPTSYGSSECFYDEPLPYYIYENGQCQESSRDQGHTMCGLSLYANIAEMCWNQGDDLYGAYDNRILLGHEFTYRYNHSLLEGNPWEPTGYTEGNDATFDNGKYIQRRSRSTRWKSLAPYSTDRGDAYTNGLMRECALAHYAVRAGLDPQKYTWLKKSVDRMVEKYGYEAHGKTYDRNGNPYADNWFYEFPGYGTLTKRRGTWQAGDPVVAGKYKMHTTDETINAADFDLYLYEKGASRTDAYGKGHTWDGNIATSGTGIKAQQSASWVSYTIFVSEKGDYCLNLGYTATGTSSISVAVDGGNYCDTQLTAGASSAVTSAMTLEPGLHVFRLRLNTTSATVNTLMLTKGTANGIIAINDKRCTMFDERFTMRFATKTIAIASGRKVLIK